MNQKVNASQLMLPGFEPVAAMAGRTSRQRPRTAPRAAERDDDLVQLYERRLVAYGAAPAGANAYRYQLRAILRAAHRLAGRSVSMTALFRDEALLGRAIVDDSVSSRRQPLSRWTLAQRRSAVRSFARLVRPELSSLLSEDPHQVLDRALRGVAERVGGGYRLPGGAPRRRGGYVPTSAEVRNVVDVVGREPGFAGPRNRAFFSILSATGSRVNALRLLDGADCLTMPNGRWRLYLHEKGKAEPREVELDREAVHALQDYANAFNAHAARRGWRARVRVGEPGFVWRNSPRGRWGYTHVLSTLATGCTTAEVTPFSPHALRRAFATDAATVLPRHVVAQAGGWKGLERLDDHYVRPREPTIWRKLTGNTQISPATETERNQVDAPTLAL